MQRRRLGELEVSVLGLGTVKFGRNTAVKYPEPFAIPDDGQVRRLLHLALDLGINLIDTAPAYGASEQRLGELLRGGRKDWVICTKAGETFDAGGDRSSFDFSPEAVRASVERSLRRLQTDYLDIVLLHSDGSDLEILDGGALDTLNDLKRAGWVRSVGVSSKTPEGALASVEQADTAMLALTPEYREDEPAILRAAELGKAVLLKKLIDSGHRPEQMGEAMQLAFAHAGVASAVIGTINPEHLRGNAALAEAVCG